MDIDKITEPEEQHASARNRPGTYRCYAAGEEHRIRRQWDKSGAPDLHRNDARRLAETDGTPWHDLLSRLWSEIGTGATVVLCGSRGTGKTQLGVNLIRECLLAQATALYVNARDLFFELRATYVTGATRSEFDVVKKYVDPFFLVIDEAHARSNTEWEDLTLTHIIDKRYAFQRDTVLITNETPDAARQSLGPSTTERIRQTGGFILCAWPSFRDEEGA